MYSSEQFEVKIIQWGAEEKTQPLTFVIYHHEKGLKYTEMAKMLRLSKSTVRDIVRRYRDEDRIESIPQKGQPKKLTEREERSIRKKIKE